MVCGVCFLCFGLMDCCILVVDVAWFASVCLGLSGCFCGFVLFLLVWLDDFGTAGLF